MNGIKISGTHTIQPVYCRLLLTEWVTLQAEKLKSELLQQRQRMQDRAKRKRELQERARR